jgi:acyl dehydratase
MSVPSLTTLYPKALAMPLLRRVPGGGGSGLPVTVVEVEDHLTPEAELAAYREVCGFGREDRLPPTWPHVVAFPMAMKIMTERAFPFAVLGLVHIANEIDQLRPIAPDEPLSLRVHAGDLGPHPRGTQFTIHAEGAVGGRLVWRSRSVYLKRDEGSGGPSEREPRVSPPGRTPAEEPGPLGRRSHWRVPADIGRRYGAVSGDRNPIHLYGWSARLFGMPRPIAHGMWVKARCLAELEPTLPDAFTVAVRFKLPLFLPAQVAFGVRDGDFDVRDASSGKPHLAGELGGVA